MIDQTSIDLLRLVGGNMSRVAGTNGGEYAGACPFCGGRDRFRVWPTQGRWWCRRCERHGDALAFVRERDKASFGKALRTLRLEGDVPTRSRPARQPVLPPSIEPPPQAWQQAARMFVDVAQAALWADNERPLTWLRRREFADDTLVQARIGYHAGAGRQGDQQWVARSRWGLPTEEHKLRIWLPRGIVIPWFADGHLWRIFIRRPVGEPKYYVIPGSGNALYNADTLAYGKPAVLVEAALDALAIQQEAGDLVAPVATGTTGARGHHWVGKMARCHPLLLAYDHDAGGRTPTAYWKGVFRERAHIWRPYPDDPAAMLEYGVDVRGWITAGLRYAGYPLPLPRLHVHGNDDEGWYVCERRGEALYHWFADERCFATSTDAQQAAQAEQARLASQPRGERAS